MADETSFTPKPPSTPEEHPRPIIHTYGDDMAHAMDATDASVVAELMATAREREHNAKEVIHERAERAWFTTGALILLVLAIASGLYGIFHYRHLTVPVAPTYSVGVFPSVDSVNADTTTVAKTVTLLQAIDNLSINKPTLVPLVHTDGSALSNQELFSFLGARMSEPFQTAVDAVRLGVMNTGTTVESFLIFSVRDPEVATKEFLIAEPTFLQSFSATLDIDTTTYQEQIGKNFESVYRYNLPLRILSAPDTETATHSLILYYGYATDHTIVMATDPSVLKAVYDSIISQH
jgi:hypothetical protein